MALIAIEKFILKLPLMGSVYWNNAARLKRMMCMGALRLGILKPYSFVQWLATNRCNMHCAFCEASAGKETSDELSTTEAKAMIDDLSGMGVKRLILSGGEPLMRPDLPEILEHAASQGMHLGLVSNGFFVGEHWETLRRHRWFLYFTSLDGAEEQHNRSRGHHQAFEHALEGLELFKTLGVPLRMVNTVVHAGNLAKLDTLLPVLQEAAPTHWRLAPITRVGRAAKLDDLGLSGPQLRELAGFAGRQRTGFNVDFSESHAYLNCLAGLHNGKPFFCGAGLTRCAIMSDGTVIGCHAVYDKRMGEGNIREKPFSQIWRQGFSRFRKPRLQTECFSCEHKNACQGGCWAEMQTINGCLKQVWDDGEN